MDQWLTWSFLEGRGGELGSESYELALYFLAQHTEMDCWIKRKKRGYLFITGDELPYPILSKHIAETVVGDRLDADLKVEEIVAELQRTFVPFFVIPDQTRRRRCERRWRDLLGEHVLCMSEANDVCFVTAGAMLVSEGLVKDVHELVSVLLEAGMPKDRTGAVVGALEGLADLHGLGGGGALRRFLGALLR